VFFFISNGFFLVFGYTVLVLIYSLMRRESANHYP
jgi:hypothetical protein